MKYKTNHEYKDLKRALRVKRNRLKARILSMLENNNNCLFLTFTFNNRVMKATTQETREKYIKRYLKILNRRSLIVVLLLLAAVANYAQEADDVPEDSIWRDNGEIIPKHE